MDAYCRKYRRNSVGVTVDTTWGLVVGILAMLGIGGMHRRRRTVTLTS